MEVAVSPRRRSLVSRGSSKLRAAAAVGVVPAVVAVPGHAANALALRADSGEAASQLPWAASPRQSVAPPSRQTLLPAAGQWVPHTAPSPSWPSRILSTPGRSEKSNLAWGPTPEKSGPKGFGSGKWGARSKIGWEAVKPPPSFEGKVGVKEEAKVGVKVAPKVVAAGVVPKVVPKVVASGRWRGDVGAAALNTLLKRLPSVYKTGKRWFPTPLEAGVFLSVLATVSVSGLERADAALSAAVANPHCEDSEEAAAQWRALVFFARLAAATDDSDRATVFSWAKGAWLQPGSTALTKAALRSQWALLEKVLKHDSSALHQVKRLLCEDDSPEAAAVVACMASSDDAWPWLVKSQREVKAQRGVKAQRREESAETLLNHLHKLVQAMRRLEIAGSGADQREAGRIGGVESGLKSAAGCRGSVHTGAAGRESPAGTQSQPSDMRALAGRTFGHRCEKNIAADGWSFRMRSTEGLVGKNDGRDGDGRTNSGSVAEAAPDEGVPEANAWLIDFMQTLDRLSHQLYAADEGEQATPSAANKLDFFMWRKSELKDFFHYLTAVAAMQREAESDA